MPIFVTDVNSLAEFQQNHDMTYEDPCDTASRYQAYIHIRFILVLPKFVSDHVILGKQVPWMTLVTGSKTVLESTLPAII
jgi:hypothetical protein